MKRFSLRALLLSVTATAVVFGWVGYQRYVVEQQTSAISQLQNFGAVLNLVDFRDSQAINVTPAQPPRFTFLNYIFGKGYYIYAPQITLTNRSLTADKVRSMFPYLQQLRMKEGFNVAGKTNIVLIMSPELLTDGNLLSNIKQQLPHFQVMASVPSANTAYQ